MGDDAAWAPALRALRLLADGRSGLLLDRSATVLWWCAPVFDDAPVCWQLLDRAGGHAAFPGWEAVDADEHPAPVVTCTRLRRSGTVVEVQDALLPRGDGVLLVRLLRRLSGPARPVEHVLRLGGFDASPVALRVHGRTAVGEHRSRGQVHAVEVRADEHAVRDDGLHSTVHLPDTGWAALVVAVGTHAHGDVEELREAVRRQAAEETSRHARSRLPRLHPQRAQDALAVVRACTYDPTGAVVASPTTSLPEAPGADRQFDYRYTWLRDASLSTAVTALLGHGDDAERHLELVHRAWPDGRLLTAPLVDVRGGQVPAEREVDGVAGWAGSRPVRVGNTARDQCQYDAVGMFVEAVSVHLQVGGRLDGRTWSLVRRLADDVAAEDPDEPQPSNGIWEVRRARRLVDGDLGRWLVLDRALWVARGWRPWTRRRHWLRARDAIARRVLAALQDDLLPQSYDDDEPVPDASQLMAVAFGLLDRDDPRASRLVDAVLDRLGAGPYLRRYPPGTDDGFSGEEGAFLPMSFLAVTALATVGRTQEAQERLDRLCAALPRLLAEEVDPRDDRLLGNVPLVWSHAELARALYVLDAAQRRERWGPLGLWAWRLQRYARLRHDLATTTGGDDVRTRPDPAGPPAADVRPGSGGVGRGSSPAAEAVSDALRRGTGGFLEDRRRTAVLQTAAAALLSVVGLYQFGVLRSVPEPSLPGLDADRVDASGEAYALLRTPDSTLGIASAGVSLVLAGMGGARRHEEQPWIPLVLLAKSLVDAAGGTYLFAEQVTRHKRVCSWCTVSAGLLVATVPAVLPEARAAWRALRSARRGR